MAELKGDKKEGYSYSLWKYVNCSVLLIMYMLPSYLSECVNIYQNALG
jgi:hypothetical protein